jgi:hypothetical protein
MTLTDAINTSATILSVQSKLVVVSSLGRFLKEAFRQIGDIESELWYLRNSFSSHNAYASFVNLLRNEQIGTSRNLTSPFIENDFRLMGCQLWGEEELADAMEAAFSTCESSSGVDRDSIFHDTEKALHQFLVDMCLEHGPSALVDPAKDKLELRLVHSVLKLTHALYTPMLMARSTVSSFFYPDDYIYSSLGNR